MKQIFSSQDSAEVGLLQSVLSEADIQSVIRNEQVELQGPSFYPELWVDDGDYPAALEIFNAWRRAISPVEGPWTCPKCGERQEPQFESCWKCGAPREILA